jgi:hypothetical protein
MAPCADGRTDSTLLEPKRGPPMSKLPHTKLASALALSALTLLAAGCPSPEPEEKLNKFLEETKEERDEAMGVKMDVSGSLADISGMHLFAIAAVISPSTPLQFIADVQLTTTAEGGTMTITFQPLALDMGETTTPRTPVGELLMLPETPVDAGGAFAVDLGEVSVVGAANPITQSDITATLMLDGAIQNEDLWCGRVTGMVTMPIQLDLGDGAGSTFAATRIESADPAMLPDPVVSACPAGGDEGGSDTDTASGTDGDTDTATGG